MFFIKYICKIIQIYLYIYICIKSLQEIFRFSALGSSIFLLSTKFIIFKIDILHINPLPLYSEAPNKKTQHWQ